MQPGEQKSRPAFFKYRKSRWCVLCLPQKKNNSPAVIEPLHKTTLSLKPQNFRSPLKQEKNLLSFGPNFPETVQGDVCAEV